MTHRQVMGVRHGQHATFADEAAVDVAREDQPPRDRVQALQPQGHTIEHSVTVDQRLMPMESRESRRIAAPLAHRVGEGADAAQIAEAMAATWQEIADALTPILGQRGVAALYKRSLFLTGAAHPWLAGMHEGGTAMDLAALKAVLTQQSSAEAAAGGGALLQAFHELLTSLVGPLLSERLLRSVWATPLSGPPAKDTAP